MPTCYEQGKALYDAGEFEKALPLLLRAARQDMDAEARFFLGRIDEKAAAQQSASAQFYLGRMYQEGRGVPQDDGMALWYFQQAADQKHPEALKILDAIHFPPPPIPGDANIQPLTSPAMLRAEGRSMHHCVSGYTQSVRKGKCYIYKILKPARATMKIVPGARGRTWRVCEIKGSRNAEPTPGVLEAVWAWLRRIQYGHVVRMQPGTKIWLTLPGICLPRLD